MLKPMARYPLERRSYNEIGAEGRDENQIKQV
jgi:hypothetical protein